MADKRKASKKKPSFLKKEEEPKQIPKPKQPGIFDKMKAKVYSVFKPIPKVENVSAADKMFDRSELEERVLKALDKNKDTPLKKLEQAKKEGKEIPDFVKLDKKKSDALPEVITAEELPNPEDEFENRRKEEEFKARKEAESAEAEGDGEPAQGDIFTSPDSSEEAVSHAINALKSPENIKHFTELKDYEIKGIAALKASNARTKIDVLEFFIEEFENLRVSHERKGRLEVADVAKAGLGGGQNQQADSFIKRFFNR